ncbi:ATP-binding protein [Pantanalinema sp. GBBB05]|uniref:ATP-binding protein n=1 Tax=Pantanalinema sp. GBBB05 TaxID=2604139 RepID=UPI001D9563E4|nr:PAS domain-containing protein [Pantanalinema sp. GBBB05]
MSTSTPRPQELAQVTSTHDNPLLPNRKKAIRLPYSNQLTHWFKSLRVGQKIGYGYALSLGIAAIGATVGGILGSHYQYQASLLEEHAQEEISLISDLQTSLLQTHVHQVRLMAAIPRPDQFAAESTHLSTQTRLLQRHWAAATAFVQQDLPFDDPHHRQLPELLRQYDTTIALYIQQLTELTLLLEQVPPAATTLAPLQQQLLQYSQHRATAQVMAIADRLSEILVDSREEYEESEDHAKLVAQHQLQIIVISTIASIVIAAFLAYFTSRAIAAPIEETTQVAQAVAQTDNFNLQAPVSTNDEIGMLATSLNQLIQRFQQLQSEQKASEQQLHDSQQLLQLVIDTIPQTIFWKDRHSVFLGCNRKMAEIAGLKNPEAIVGKTDYDLPWTTAESDFYRECDRRVMDSNMPELGIVESLQTATGEQRWLETNKAPLHDRAGNVMGILATFQDITERKAAELQLQHLNQELELQSLQLKDALTQLKTSQLQLIQTEKMSSLGQLVAGVAHEINNPVNFIHGNLTHANEYIQDLLGLIELYQRYYPQPHSEIQAEIAAIDLDFLTTDLSKLLRSMRIGTDRIREIVLSLRNFSRLDESEVKDVDIHEGIDSTLTILHNRLKAKAEHPEIEVIREYGQLPRVECYAGQLNQVFMNLLSNAIDALDEWATKQPYQDLVANPARIYIRTEPLNQHWIVIRIADNGAGMTEAVRAKLFDPFFTTKPVGRGTGLGLSISHQIVTEKHGGKLYCQSQLGQGSEFTIELPIQPSALQGSQAG